MIEPTFFVPLDPTKTKNNCLVIFFKTRSFPRLPIRFHYFMRFVVYKSLNKNNIFIISKIYKNKSSHFSLKSSGLYQRIFRLSESDLMSCSFVFTTATPAIPKCELNTYELFKMKWMELKTERELIFDLYLLWWTWVNRLSGHIQRGHKRLSDWSEFTFNSNQVD